MDILILLQGMPPIPGHPVTGNGLRAHALAEGLASRGHRVRLATRSVDVPADAPPDVARALVTYDDPGAIPELVAASGAEAVVVCHWDLLERLSDPSPVPVVADLYGPRLVEAQFERAALDREGARFVDQIRHADAFLVASERQRWFALPWLMLAGLDCKTLPVHVVPISANPRPPIRFQRKPVADPVIVTGGVFWPWRDSERPLERLLATLDREARGHVELFGGTYPLATDAPVPYRDPRERLPPHARLSFHGLVPYDQLFERYARAQLAFDVMEPNAERELSFSFRVIDYLAASLPVITNRFTEIASAIESAEAGWVVDVESPRELEDVVTAALADPAEVARRGHNARRLVEDRYAWDRTIEPLDRYLRAPARATRGTSVLGTLVQVAGEAFRAREDRLREIERSRSAVRRAEALDSELAALHRQEADRATELSLIRAELEARTRDLASLKDQVAAQRREQMAHASQLEADRDRVAREADSLRADRDLQRSKNEELAVALRRSSDEARDGRATREQMEDELRGARALAEHRATERDRALETVRARDEAIARADEERKRLATDLSRGEERIHDLERRILELSEAGSRSQTEIARAKAAIADVERERDRLADSAQAASRERDQLAAALERTEAKSAETDRRLEHVREVALQREADVTRLRATVAEAERVAEATRESLTRAEEERKQLAAGLERCEAKLAETERRLDHSREQLASRELDLARAKSAALDAARETERLAQELQAATRTRDALEARAHQLEQRLDARSADVEDLARQVAALRGEIEARTAEIARKHAELEATTRERDHERSRGTVLDDEIRKLKDGLADSERERDRSARELSEAREKLDGARREAHAAAVAARVESERAANQVAALERALAHECEVRAAAELATHQAEQRLAGREDAFEALRLEAHQSHAHSSGEIERLRREAETRRLELVASREAEARSSGEIERLRHEAETRGREAAFFHDELGDRERALAATRAQVETLRRQTAAAEQRERAVDVELARWRATPVLGWWIRRLEKRRSSAETNPERADAAAPATEEEPKP